MTNTQLKEARQSLGLTQSQMARLLDTDPQSVRRMEMPATASTSRNLPPRAARLVEAYLAGYRPSDWPLTVR